MVVLILMSITLFFVLLMTLVIGVLWKQVGNISVVALYTYDYMDRKDKNFNPKSLLNRNSKKET